MQRQGPPRERNEPLNGYTCTVEVEQYDSVERKILDGGGSVVLAKRALPGMAWQGYYRDTEGNVLAIHQPDKNAK